MEQAQISKIKKTLESFLKVFDEYKDEIISERPQRSRLDKLRKELQIKEPQITRHILNILGNGSVVIRQYGSQATLSYASLLATALMGGNNEPKHNFGDFYGPVTSLLNRAIGAIDEAQLQGKETGVLNGMTVKNKKAVFVVHGRNKQLTDSMFSFLDAIGLEPIEWNEAIAMTGKPSPSIPEIVSTAFKEAQAIVVLLSGDDLAILRNEFSQENDEAYEKVWTPQARPNVLFEAGQAMAGDQERTVLVQVGKIRKFSDIQGLHITHLDNSPPKKQELITKLRNAGCDIRDISAENRWMEVGNFEDNFDVSEVRITTANGFVATGKPIDERQTSLLIEQTRNLQFRIQKACEADDTNLIVDFIDEYLGILDAALDIRKDDKHLKNLKERGMQNKPRLVMIFPSTDDLKWILNEIERLLVLLHQHPN